MYNCQYSTENLISILVEITTFCNMKCSGCIRTIKNNDNIWGNQHLKLVDFRRIVEGLPNADEIVTQGVGEPTMHPQLPEILAVAKESKKFANITFTSNGLARDEKYYAQLFEAGLTRLYISVDSFDNELANRLRKGTNVIKLKKIIQNLAASFPGKIAIRSVVGSLNLNYVEPLLSELDALGKLRIYFHPYDDIGYPEGTLSLQERLNFDASLTVMASPFKNLEVYGNGFIPSNEVCIHPWKIPAITADGYLVPCCRVMDKNIFNFGNVITQPFNEVWNSASSNLMRKEFIKESPSYCKGCTRYAMRKI